jgi:hypothetical protein
VDVQGKVKKRWDRDHQFRGFASNLKASIPGKSQHYHLKVYGKIKQAEAAITAPKTERQSLALGAADWFKAMARHAPEPPLLGLQGNL